MMIKGMVLCVSFKSFKRHGTYYDSYLSFDEMMKLPKGRELRNIHDDITMIICDLNNIVKFE